MRDARLAPGDSGGKGVQSLLYIWSTSLCRPRLRNQISTHTSVEVWLSIFVTFRVLPQGVLLRVVYSTRINQ